MLVTKKIQIALITFSNEVLNDELELPCLEA
jgi:hypothetical protein